MPAARKPKPKRQANIVEVRCPTCPPSDSQFCKPTEADMARRAGFGNWVDRVAELEADLESLRRRCALFNMADLVSCCQCGTATNHLAGNPSLWPHLLCTDPQQPGVSQVWCEGCLTGMVAENARLKRLAPLSVSNLWLEIVCLRDKVKELEAEAQRMSEMWTFAGQRANAAEDQLALVHSRLDAMGVPACETEPCIACGGDGYFKGPRLGDEPCPDCNGTGQRPVACRHCNGTKLDPFWSCHVCPVCHGADTVDRLTARLDWVAERLKAWDTLSQDAKDEATQWVRVKLKDVGDVPPMPYDGVDYDRIDPEVGL